MPLLNYTSNVSIERTAEEIKRCLVTHGAQAIMTEYDPQSTFLVAISFKISLNDQTLSFRLPCDWKPVYEVMYKGKRNTRQESVQSARQEQSMKTAWRIVKDWVEAQMALVETRMATTQQVFLPYTIMKDGRTLSDHVSSNPNFLLGGGH